VAPYFTPEWGDISRLTSGRIYPSREKAGWLSAAGVNVGRGISLHHLGKIILTLSSTENDRRF
jgi:hypothetical protein